MEILLLPLSEAKENRHVRPYCLANSLDDFRGKTCARLCIAPIAILTQIRFRPQEAVDQISARAMYGDAIETHRLGVFGASSRSEEHTSELQSLMRISYAVFCLKNKNKITYRQYTDQKTPTHNTNN